MKSCVFEEKAIESGSAAAELARDVALSLGPHFFHHLFPFAVGEAGRVVPRFYVSFPARVRPKVVAVRREVQSHGIGTETSREQGLETERSVLSAHSSGKTRLSSVDRR